jgi:hypothetical protein
VSHPVPYHPAPHHVTIRPVTPKLAELIILEVLGVLVFGAFAYLIVSYFVMARHVGPRSRLRHAAAMLRELFFVIITQPLIPLYYVVGRVMGPGDGTPVVFVTDPISGGSPANSHTRRWGRCTGSTIHGSSPLTTAANGSASSLIPSAPRRGRAK